MKKTERKNDMIKYLIYKDCISVLPVPFLFCTFGSAFGGVITVYAAEILGEFADAVFHLDFRFGMTNLVKLLGALGVSLLIIPLIEMCGELFLFKAALQHERLIWARLMDKAYENLIEIDEGEILARLDIDPINFRIYFMMIWSKALSACVTGFYLLNTALKASVQLSIIVMVASSLKLIVPLAVRRLQAKYDEQERGYTTETRKMEGEMTKSAHSIKLFGMEKGFIERLDRMYCEYYKNIYCRSIKAHALAEHILSFVDSFCVLFILYIGAIHVSNGFVTAGVIAAMLGYYSSFNRVISCVDYVVRKIPIVQNLEGRMRIFYEGMESDADSVLEEVVTMRTEALSYSYEEGKSIGWKDFTLKRGMRVALYGLNGSGKSTLLKIISGLLKSYRGQLYLNGTELREVSVSSWRRQFAFVEQEPYLFEGTILENIQIGNLEASDTCMRDVLEEVGLTDLAKRQLSLEQNELSGGEKQKIAIARAILRNVSLLIMDEPSNNLDGDSVKWLCDFLKNTDKTVIYVSHEKRLLTIADQVIEVSYLRDALREGKAAD